MLAIGLEILFKLIGYSLIIYSLWLMVGQGYLASYLGNSYQKYRRKRRIRKLRSLTREQEQDNIETSSYLMNHLHLILSSLKKETTKLDVANFLFFSVTLFSVATIFLVIFLKDFLIGLLLGGLIGLFPYLFLRLRLTGLRLRTSMIFLKYFNIFLQNYQSSNKNIYLAMLHSSREVKDSHMKMVLMKLVNAMQLKRNPIEFKEAVNVFVFSINSTFAKRFGKLIIKGHLDQADISDSLFQLSLDIKKRKTDMEEEKTNRQDTVYLGFFPLITLPTSLWFVYYIAGGLDFWYYFNQKGPFTLFVISVVVSVLSVITAIYMKQPNADI